MTDVTGIDQWYELEKTDKSKIKEHKLRVAYISDTETIPEDAPGDASISRWREETETQVCSKCFHTSKSASLTDNLLSLCRTLDSLRLSHQGWSPRISRALPPLRRATECTLLSHTLLPLFTLPTCRTRLPADPPPVPKPHPLRPPLPSHPAFQRLVCCRLHLNRPTRFPEPRSTRCPNPLPTMLQAIRQLRRQSLRR
jgi:hypothetical protein